MELPAPATRPNLLFLAGEHSGDQHAARMLREALAVKADMTVCAIGGTELEHAGAQLLFDLVPHSVVGLFEVLKNYGFFKELMDKIVAWIKEHRPRTICLVDYPGFNLRLAARLQKEGISVKGGGDVSIIYYISPQIWAWKSHRRFKMAKLIDAMAVIFPFEVDCYADTDLPVTYVGHPFTERDYQLPLRYDPEGPILLLPGSRKTPVRRIFPLMLRGFEQYCVQQPDAPEALAIYPTDELRALSEALIKTYPKIHDKVQLLAADNGVTGARAVLTSSGTMSLNCALAAIPGAIVYRANPLTYLIGRRVVKIDRLGIANILLKRDIYPEFLQGAATSSALSQELDTCLMDPARAARTAQLSSELASLLSEQREISPGAWLLGAPGIS
ncbi:MAG: lipid-A-disaccharide synthase [Verrucomicrobiota bacterium]